MLREWGCQLCNELDPETRKARPEEPRAGVDILERGQLARLLTSGLGGLGEHCKLLSGVGGGAPESLDFGVFWVLRNHARTIIA